MFDNEIKIMSKIRTSRNKRNLESCKDNQKKQKIGKNHKQISNELLDCNNCEKTIETKICRMTDEHLASLVSESNSIVEGKCKEPINKSSNSNDHINCFPQECWIHIFCFLSYREVLVLRNICQAWRQAGEIIYIY